MPRYERLSFPHDREIATAIAQGRLGALILANASDLDLRPSPAVLELPSPALSEYEDAVVIGAINGMTSTEIGKPFPKGQQSPKTVERALKEVMTRVGAANRPQLSRYLFSLGLALPDEEIPSATPDLTPAVTVVLGLVSHGLSNDQIVAATAPHLSDGAVKRSLIDAGDRLRSVRGITDERRGAALTTTLAFEHNVFSSNPDLAMTPAFIVAGMQRLLDPAHDLAIPAEPNT